MTLVQLQHFRTLAYVLHYTKASEQLHIAQPSLSYSIAELERSWAQNSLAGRTGKSV